jgi:hypothetical protein
MLLAWLTLIGAAIGVRERNHFTLHVLPTARRRQAIVDRIHHVWSRSRRDRRWYGVQLCVLNHTLVTPGLSINLALLYASAWSAARCWWSMRCR